MLITKNGVSSLGGLEYSWETQEHKFWWKGLVFVHSIPCGTDSLERFSKEISRSGIQDAVNCLKGNFLLVVEDKKSGVYYSFVDNSSLFQAFYSDTSISTSFLELVKYEGLSRSDLDKEAIVEFLHFGHISFRKTFFDSIKKIPGKQILTFSDDGKICFLPKLVPDLNAGDGQSSFLNFFEGLVSSIKNQNVSVDLSGGIDSRMLATILDYFGLDFEIDVTGWKGHIDIEISKEVASVLKHKHHVTDNSVDLLKEEELLTDELFSMCDGLFNILTGRGQLLSNKNRVGRGVDLKFTGAGGELYKDFWWLQDFPFYARRKANVERLFNLRIAPTGFNHFYFTDDYVEICQNLKHNTVQKLSSFIIDANTKTYDNIYFNYRMQEIAGRRITNDNSLLKSYAPLLELDVVRYGFNIPRKERFFNNFHRRTITSINPNVAKIRTTESGMTVSSFKTDIIKDISKYIINKSARLTKKVGQKILKRTYFQQILADPLYVKVKELKISTGSVEFLKDFKIINEKLEVSNISNSHIGNFISLAMFMRCLE